MMMNVEQLRMRIGRSNRSVQRKPAPLSVCPPQIPHDLTLERTRAAAVGTVCVLLSLPISFRVWPILKIFNSLSLEDHSVFDDHVASLNYNSLILMKLVNAERFLSSRK
jgi:hypothetical protein